MLRVRSQLILILILPTKMFKVSTLLVAIIIIPSTRSVYARDMVVDVFVCVCVCVCVCVWVCDHLID